MYRTPLIKSWFDNKGDRSNCVHLVAAYQYDDPNAGGFTRTSTDLSIIFEGNFTGANIDKRVKDTVVHELGHHFNLLPGTGHIDDYVDQPNHAGTDRCLMSYFTNTSDGISEFCNNDCIDTVRDLNDPF